VTRIGRRLGWLRGVTGSGSDRVGRILHVTIDVRGAIGMPARALRGMLRRLDGSLATASETREWLLDHLQEGRKRLPIGEPCDGFSYETGCPGHEEG
jgi:hypothetical protein